MPIAVYILLLKKMVGDAVANALESVWPPGPPLDFP